MQKVIFYTRASTDINKQKNSVDIQIAVLNRFAINNGFEVVKTFTEYASGGNDERVEFNKALDFAKKNGYFLCAARIDRVSRSMSIFARIQDHLHLLRFAELGNAEPNVMLLGVLLGVAHQERINTSVRVKAAYQQIKLTNPNHAWGNPNIMTDAQPLGLKVRKENAANFNVRIQGVCDDLRSAGYCTLAQLVIRLNDMGITTRRGGPFTTSNLHRVLSYGG